MTGMGNQGTEKDFLAHEGISMRLIKEWQQSVNYEFLIEFLARHKAWIIEQAKIGNLTMLECLDQESRNQAYSSWADACMHPRDYVDLNYIPQRAAKTYANQFKPKWIPCHHKDILEKGRYVVFVHNAQTDCSMEVNLNIYREKQEISYFFATRYYKVIEPKPLKISNHESEMRDIQIGS